MAFSVKKDVSSVLLKDNGNLIIEIGDNQKNHSVEILNKNDGAPYVNILDDIMVDCFDTDVDISISHIKKYATATAVSVNPPFRL